MQSYSIKHKLENNDIENEDFIKAIKSTGLFSGFVIGHNKAKNTGKIVSAIGHYNQRIKAISIVDEQNQFELNVKNKNIFTIILRNNSDHEFNSNLMMMIRSGPDMVISRINEKISDLKPITDVMLTGHYSINMWDRGSSVLDTIRLFINSKKDTNYIIDLILGLSFIYAGKSCIADDNLNFIEINEYILLNKETRNYLYTVPEDEIPKEFQNIMKENKWTFADDLEKKFRAGLISEKYYKIYTNELNSTSR